MIVEIISQAEISGRFVAGMEPVYDKVRDVWSTAYVSRVENFKVKLLVPREENKVEKVDITAHLGTREYSKLYEVYLGAITP